MDQFARMGGTINFVLGGNQVRLEINLEAAERAWLKMSAKLLALARIVTEEHCGGRS